MPLHTPQLYIKIGHSLLATGDITGAIKQFRIAATKLGVPQNLQAEAYHMLGVALEVAGQFGEADRAFKQARKLIPRESEWEGRVLRDWAQVKWKNGDEYEAYFFLGESRRLLRDNPVELAMSDSYFGRLHLWRRQRQAARDEFLCADDILSEFYPSAAANHDYELNNLVWLLKVLPMWRRLRYIRRAYGLVRITDQTRRKKELHILLLSGERGHHCAERVQQLWHRVVKGVAASARE